MEGKAVKQHSSWGRDRAQLVVRTWVCKFEISLGYVDLCTETRRKQLSNGSGTPLKYGKTARHLGKLLGTSLLWVYVKHKVCPGSQGLTCQPLSAVL